MKHCKIAFLLISVMLFSLLSGCGARSKLIGTWEAHTEASILGISIDIPLIGNSVIVFSFEKDGTGVMTSEFGTFSGKRAYTYTVAEDKLTLTYESGSVEEYTFVVEKDVLKLDGRVDLELNKVS